MKVKNKMTNDNSVPLRFLVVRTDFLGDSVLSSSFIHMLKQVPNARIDSLSYEYNFVAFKYNSLLENKYCLFKNPKNSEDNDNNHMVLGEIKQNKYNAVFMLNRDYKTYKLLKYINSPKIFGHRLGVKSIRSKMFCKISELSNKYNYVDYYNSIHEVINQYNLLNLGLRLLKIPTKIELDTNSYFYSTNFNPDENYMKDSETVVVNISGRRETVRYIPSSLARTIIEDLLKLGKKVLIIATKDETVRANELVSYFDNTRVMVFIDSDLFNIADTMAKYQYYIGADGGLLHIAAGLQMGCIGLFHAQNIDSWHPWTRFQVCIQTTSKKIYDLTSEEVINAFKKLEEKYV